MPPVTLHDNTLDPDNTKPGYFASDASGTNFIVLQIVAPLNRQETVELEARGVKFQTLVHNDGKIATYICRYLPSDLTALEALPWVKRALVYHEDFVIDPMLKQANLMHPSSGVQTKTSSSGQLLCKVEVYVHKDTGYDGDKVLEDICNTSPVATSIEKVYSTPSSLCVWLPEAVLPAVARRDYVKVIAPMSEIKLYSIKGRVIMKLLKVPWMYSSHLDTSMQLYAGSGQTVAVVDSGLDDGGWPATHPCFQKWNPNGDIVSRVINTDDNSKYNGSTVNLSDWDMDGTHGTHVAGCVAGAFATDKTQRSDNSMTAGTAPAASIYVQSTKATNGDYNGIFEQLVALRQSEMRDVAIVNCSWGSNDDTIQQNYVKASPLDLLTWNHKDLLLVLAAGNEGAALLRKTLQDADVQPFNRQIAAQSGAKNALIVGCSWSARNMKPYANTGSPDIMRFSTVECIEEINPLPPNSGFERENCVAATSSKGPTKAGILKPDVVAPGTGILNARPRNWWTWFSSWKTQPNQSNTAELFYSSGTSMAAPHVSGVAACVREAAAAQNPSTTLKGFTIKAIIINGATSMAGGKFWYMIRDSGKRKWQLGTLREPPDCVQGHGLVNYYRAIAHVDGSHSSVSAGYREYANAQGNAGLDTSIPVKEADEKKFSVTLTWYDTDGEALAHDLRLHVTLQAVNKDTQQSRQVYPTDATVVEPRPPELYTNYYPITTSNPPEPISLGTVQKVVFTVKGVDLGVGSTTENLVLNMNVRTASAIQGTDQVPYALVWLMEPDP